MNRKFCKIGFNPKPSKVLLDSIFWNGLELIIKYNVNRLDIKRICLWICLLSFDLKKNIPKTFIKKIHNKIDPSWLPQAEVILKNKGSLIKEFWKTLRTVKSDIAKPITSNKKGKALTVYIEYKKKLSEEINFFDQPV